MPVCVPIKDLKDTAKFSRLVEEADGPITVTKNGYDAFVVMRSSDYDRMVSDRDAETRRKLLERVALAELEIAEGRYEDGPSVLAEMRAKHGV